MILKSDILGRVGERIEVQEDVKVDMKAFVLSKVYGESVDATYAHARVSKWKNRRKGVWTAFHRMMTR